MSSVPEVLAALLTVGQATLPNSQVIEGISTVTLTQGRLLLIGDEEFEIQREADSISGTSFTEEYVVPCGVIADVPGATQSVADAQAWADYEAMEAAIAGNPTLGLSGSFSLNASIVQPRFRRLGNSDGRHAMVRFGIHVFAANA